MITLRLLDVAAFAILAVRRWRLARGVLATLVLLAAWSWTRPPVACTCFGPVFRRCDPTLPRRAAVLSDLKNLTSQQEIYFADYGEYSDDPEGLAFFASGGVRVSVVASGDRWSARAVHDRAPERVCTARGSVDGVTVDCPP